MKCLSVGDRAPDFNLRDHNNNDFNLNEHRGKWVVLYFFPKEITPQSIQEARDFNKYSSDFNSLGSVIVGVSPASISINYNLMEKSGKDVIVLSDVDLEVCKQYSSEKRINLMGREITSISRDTYLIDPHGNIECIWRGVSVVGHAKMVLEKIREKRFLSRSIIS